MKFIYSFKQIAVVIVILASALSELSAQTADEKTALKKLGSKGFVIYEKDKAIYKYDLDGTGEVKPVKIVDSGVNPSVSHDGAYIAYVTKDAYTGTSKKCFIWVMRSDGTNKKRLNEAPLEHVSSTNFDNKLNVVYTAGPVTVRTTENMPQKLWTMDLQGTQKLMLDYSGGTTGSYEYISHFDLHDDWLTWRWNAKAYVGQFKGNTKQGGYGSVKDMGQRCGNCFNPAGDKITINSVDHKSVVIWAKSNTSWSATSTVIKSAQKHTNMRWSNLQKWVLFRKEELDADCYAINMDAITERVRITFAGSTHSPNLFIGDVTGVVTPGRNISELTIARSTTEVPYSYSIDGRILHKSTPAAMVKLSIKNSGPVLLLNYK